VAASRVHRASSLSHRGWDPRLAGGGSGHQRAMPGMHGSKSRGCDVEHRGTPRAAGSRRYGSHCPHQDEPSVSADGARLMDLLRCKVTE
jgi:hypothetical protein